MQIDSAMSYGLQGLGRAQQQVEQGSREIASLPVQSESSQSKDLTQSVMTLQQGQNEAQASARVVKSADDMMGTLIDIRV
ncbi:flagellar biosynthesis protein FlgE [Pseudaeromonas sp. ZJS20]|uniref:flagellar biosynthesis protein FlgE n=1 Tax=Pseudaeromonas aegiceratis TaxID=3153928 RepID=UPI00390CDAA6